MKNKIIIKLLNTDYVIFLSHKFFGFFNSGLLKYFRKYNIIYFKYDKHNEILELFTKLIHKWINYCCATKVKPIVKPKIPPMVSITVKK